ncbi:MAG: aminotransferase class III-fold pyridoxal phosphate-dependent enzyme [Gammaproteobacteria bacterium]|nr:aminotransferase class III-fold pyridoxal phosphate-dependent enzyme [Gammaproteobacteria bacterium]
MKDDLAFYFITAIVILFVLLKVYIRLRLSRAKHPSLRCHAKWSRRMSRFVPYFEYDEKSFYCCDAAPADIAQKRRQGMERLRLLMQNRSPETIKFSQSLVSSISDVNFTNSYRVPFPFRKVLSDEFKTGSIVEQAAGVKIKDIDGNWNYDLSGSYGVNVFGYDFYRDCMEQGFARVKELGPVLGPYHPLIRDNVEKLKSISGLDEVSFHMSGTEAVMQAVRLARYHTGKTHLVRLCGAYHGWWDGVQPGVGNQRKVNDVYTLADLSDATLKVLETRSDIACVLINPLQALHPNADASSDASLINSARSAHFDHEKYSLWLQQIRDVCSRKNIVLIFDEVFTGFRLAYRGAQEFFKVQADMVTYGKTLGGGLPVGVVCGRHHLMKRFKDEQPANISFARGTFNSHPYVMGSMNEFLHRIEQPEIQQIYREANDLWNRRVAQLNQQLEQQGLAIKIANLHSIWTVLYTLPGRYNWMLQFYLRAEGLEISWVGSGRIIMSLNYTDAEFNEVATRFIRAAIQMKADGWCWQSPQLSDKSIKQQMLQQMIVTRFPLLKKFMHAAVPECVQSSIEEVQQQ